MINFIMILTFLFSLNSFAATSTPEFISFDGQLLDLNGGAVNSGNVTFKVEIVVNLSGSYCVLRSETFNQDMTNKNGYFNLSVGSGTLISGSDLKTILNKDYSGSCSGASSVNREIKISVNTGSGFEEFQKFTIQSAAYALVAEKSNSSNLATLSEDSSKLGGRPPADYALTSSLSNYATTSSLGNYIQKSGDTMTGSLILNSNPTSAMQASTKQYVDNAVAGVNIVPTWSSIVGKPTTIAGYGITDAVTSGSLATSLTNYATTSSLGNYVQKSGDTMTGSLALSSGTTSVAPLKIPSGTLLSSVTSGAIESDGNNLFWTNSTPTRKKLLTLQASASPANGQILIGNGTDFSLGSITAGSGISITNSAGSISISATAGGGGSGTVTSVSSSNTDISVSNGSSTATLTLNSGTTGGASDSNKIAKLDAGGLLSSSMIPALDASKISSGTFSIARGGTNSTSALNNNRIMVSNSGAIVESAALTANRVLASDSNGIPVATTVAVTQLDFLSGVTSNIQTQLNSKLSNSGWGNYSVIGTNASGSLTNISGSVNGSILQYSPTGPIFSSASYPSTTTANQLLYSSSANVVGGLTSVGNAILTTNASGVPSWSTFSSDVFSQYAMLAGRAGGQTIYGGTAASNNLILDSTANATKGNISLNPGGGGNLGIGVSSPSYFIHAKLPNTSSSFVLENNDSTYGLHFGKANGNINSSVIASGLSIDTGSYCDTTSNGWKIKLDGSNDSFSIERGVCSTAGSGAAISEKMRIDSSGNIGVGTISPSAKLQVNSSSTSSKAMVVRGVASQTANLTEWQNSTGTALAVVGPTGNFGFGTTTPASKLDVSGDINVTGKIKINGTTVSPGIDSCPSGYNLVGSGRNAFCISNLQGPASFGNAISVCDSSVDAVLGKAHLCRTDEWYSSCKSLGTNTETWVFQFYDTSGAVSAFYMGDGASCGSVGRDTNTALKYYRCCL